MAIGEKAAVWVSKSLRLGFSQGPRAWKSFDLGPWNPEAKHRQPP